MLRNTLVVDGRTPLPARKLFRLVQQALKVNKTTAIRVIQHSGVRVNGRAATSPLSTLEVGDRIEIEYAEEDHRPAPSRCQSPVVSIVFQDSHLVVIDKPPGLLTVPTPRKERDTAISQLEMQLKRDGTGEQAFCVHRLDRDVSGLLVFGKKLEVAKRLRDQFEQRKPQRLYVALVAGVLRRRDGTFRSYLATDRELNQYSTPDAEEGDLAITHYRTLATSDNVSLVEVSLETGRRNQIRVHFSEAGHPVLGDRRYGNDDEPDGRWLHSRLALHARTLGFTHPVNGGACEFHSPLPRELREFLRAEGIVSPFDAPRSRQGKATRPRRSGNKRKRR